MARRRPFIRCVPAFLGFPLRLPGSRSLPSSPQGTRAAYAHEGGRLCFFLRQACEKIVLFLTFSTRGILPRVLAALFDARKAEFSRQAGVCLWLKRSETAGF